MLARMMLSLTLVLGLVAVGSTQDKKANQKKEVPKKERKIVVRKHSDELNERVLSQVERALSKFEKELGKEKMKSILGQVKRGLQGAHDMHFKLDLKDLEIDPAKLHEHLDLKKNLELHQHLGLHKDHGGATIIRRLATGNQKRKMIGVMLHAEDDDSIVKVKEVMKDSAAEKAGIKAGDVIVKVNGKKVEDPKSLSEAVQKSKGQIKVAVKRGKKNMVIEVEPKLVKAPGIAQALIELDELKVPDVIEVDGKKIRGVLKGSGVIDLNDDFFKKMSVPKGSSGIIQVHPGDGEQRIELIIEDKDGKREIHRKVIDAHSKKKGGARSSDDSREVEKRIEVKSDLGEVLEKLQKQMKELQNEIKELKKSRK